MSVLVEIKLALAEEILRQLHEHSLRRGVSEDIVVEQALGLLFAQDEPSPQSDYWFAASAMRADWDAMPEDEAEFSTSAIKCGKFGFTKEIPGAGMRLCFISGGTC